MIVRSKKKIQLLLYHINIIQYFEVVPYWNPVFWYFRAFYVLDTDQTIRVSWLIGVQTRSFFMTLNPMSYLDIRENNHSSISPPPRDKNLGTPPPPTPDHMGLLIEQSLKMQPIVATWNRHRAGREGIPKRWCYCDGGTFFLCVSVFMHMAPQYPLPPVPLHTSIESRPSRRIEESTRIDHTAAERGTRRPLLINVKARHYCGHFWLDTWVRVL